jgi:hypothetical protein
MAASCQDAAIFQAPVLAVMVSPRGRRGRFSRSARFPRASITTRFLLFVLCIQQKCESLG